MAQQRLTHVDERGAARMVDVSAKQVTQRSATAAGRVRVSAAVVALLRGEGVPKGDALAVARIAGIAAAKQTPSLVPLCHPLAISGVEVELAVRDDAVEIEATVRTADRTGVEMEALTAVTVAALTVIDMVKAVDKHAVIDAVRVVAKSGGRSGDWVEEGHGASIDQPADDTTDELVPAGRRGAVVVASNRASAGVYDDTTGPLIVEALRSWGLEVDEPAVVPDGAPVGEAIAAALESGARVVLTTGGTGVSPTDRTPEVTAPLLTRPIAGLAEAIRAAGVAKGVPTAALSRGLAGVAETRRGAALVVNLPGSRGGVKDALEVLADVVPHAVDQLAGGDHPREPR